MKVAIIGGGAAGFFAAIHVKENHPQAQVTIFEKSPKLLSKVKVSGGGRCNVTNGCTDIVALSKAYPRGQKSLKKAFHTFSTQHTMDWFQSRNVPLTIQEDGCVFPVSQDSQTIIDCFLGEARKANIRIETSKGVKALTHKEGQITLSFIGEHHPSLTFDKIIITTGGSPKRRGLEWLEILGHQIEDPVPSLFTFNMPREDITSLMGIVVEETIVSIQGTKLKASGPLLITHWGMSGPAILKLSAFGARILHNMAYSCTALVNWVNERNEQQVLETLQRITEQHPGKNINNFRPYALPDRLWQFLIQKMQLNPVTKWGNIGLKSLHKITNILTQDHYTVQGKTTFKEEFVTCGGISLESINMKTMQSKVCPGIYFAGEIMDIDGITGGYNFQAAWTTAYIAAQLK